MMRTPRLSRPARFKLNVRVGSRFHAPVVPGGQDDRAPTLQANESEGVVC